MALVAATASSRCETALDGGISLTDAVVLLQRRADSRCCGFSGGRRTKPSFFAQRWHGMNGRCSAQAQQSAACNASHSVEARRRAGCCARANLCGGEKLPLTQNAGANDRVQHNAVSIVAHALRKDGIIRYGRGISKYKSGGLRGTSCECYQASRHSISDC